MASISTTFFRVVPTAKPEKIKPTATVLKQMRDDAFEMTVFDVGPGEAILLRRRQLAVLVDGGAGGRKEHTALGAALAGYIRAKGIKLAAIVASHPHQDHLNALSTLLTVDGPPILANNAKYFENGEDMSDSLTDTLGVVLSRAGSQPPSTVGLEEPLFSLGDVKIRMAVDDDRALEHRPKYRSVFMAVTFRNARFLLTGDAYEEYENALLKFLAGNDTRQDVLKITHHGSHDGTSRKFANSATPRISVASTAGDSGHDLADRVKRALRPHGWIYHTASTKGDIRIRTDGNQRSLNGRQGILYEVQQFRPGRLKPHL